MTPSSPQPDRLDSLLGEVRQLSTHYQAGGAEAFGAFFELVKLLLRLKVMEPSQVLTILLRSRDRAVLGGQQGPTDALRLKNGHFLRLAVSLRLRDSFEQRLQVEKASCQYQLQKEDDWVFRYDYLRTASDHWPAAHLQVHGEPALDQALPEGRTLGRVHFPTGRVSLEAVVRLLVDDFHVPCNEESTLWGPVLAETERHFLEIAHQPGAAGSPTSSTE